MRGSDESLVRLGRAPRADALSETKLLAELEHRLFGRDIEPVRLQRYVLLERVGSGAFGSVYLGYDPQLDRKVAIKLLHGAGHSDDDRERAHARLLDEAKALARLSHPNVVAVYDVGSFDSAQRSTAQVVAAHASGMLGAGVFVVMELVDGETLRAWLTRVRPTRRQILDVFVQAGEGLAAAHAAGIVHRDFKPDNVLVGGDRRVRIADFGIAASAAVERPAIEIAGTPAYGAPEQLAGAPPDARADQYAFAVALYEALSGERPTLELDGTTRREQAMSRGQVAIAADVRLPKWLRAALVRALALEPAARHPDMRALLTALRRGERTWLPPTIALGLVGVLGLGMWLSVDRDERDCVSARESFGGAWDPEVGAAIRERFAASGAPAAEQTWSAVAAALDAHVEAWDAQWRELCRAGLGAGDDGPSARAERLRCLARDVQRVGALTQLFREADAMIVSRAIESVHELPALEPCSGPGDHDPLDADDRSEAAAIAGDLVRADELGRANHFDAALALAAAAVERAHAIDDPSSIAAAEIALGGAYQRAGDHAAAETTLRTALTSAELAGDDELPVRAMAELVRALTEQGRLEAAEGVAAVAEARIAGGDVGDAAIARLLYQTGILRTSEGRHELAAAQLERGLELAERLYGPDHPHVAQFHNTLGNAYKDAGRYTDALAELELGLVQHRRLLGPRHPTVALALNNIANVHWKQGELDTALTLYREAAEIVDAWFPSGHPNMTVVDSNLGSLLQQLGRDAEALPHFDRAIDLRRRAGGNTHLELAMLLHARAFADMTLRRYDEARADLVESIDLRVRALGPDHPDTARSLDALGEVETERGRLAEALELHERALRIRRERLGEDHLEISTSRLTTADTLERLGRLDEARDLREAALAQRERLLGVDTVDTAWALAAVGRSRLAAGRADDAVALLGTALARIERRLGPQHIALVDVLRALAQAELATGDGARARVSAHRALELLRATPGIELARFADVTTMVARTEEPTR